MLCSRSPIFACPIDWEFTQFNTLSTHRRALQVLACLVRRTLDSNTRGFTIARWGSTPTSRATNSHARGPNELSHGLPRLHRTRHAVIWQLHNQSRHAFFCAFGFNLGQHVCILQFSKGMEIEQPPHQYDLNENSSDVSTIVYLGCLARRP